MNPATLTDANPSGVNPSLYENAALYVRSVQMTMLVVKARYELAPTSIMMQMWPS